MDANAKLNAARPLDRRGVNIAARLEGIAKPGAICISEDAYRRVKARLDLPVSDLGAIQLKNIAEPVRVFSLQVGGSTTTKTTKRRRSKAALDIPVGGTVDRRACGDFGWRVVLPWPPPDCLCRDERTNRCECWASFDRGAAFQEPLGRSKPGLFRRQHRRRDRSASPACGSALRISHRMRRPQPHHQ